MTEPSLLDEQVLATLRRYGLLERLVPPFLAGLPGQIAELRDALAGGDLRNIHRRAHHLRGTAAQMGAHALACAMTELEERVTGDFAAPDSRAAVDLDDLVRRTTEALMHRFSRE